MTQPDEAEVLMDCAMTVLRASGEDSRDADFDAENLYSAMNLNLAAPGAALTELDTLAGLAGDDPRLGQMFDTLRTMDIFMRALDEGDESTMLQSHERLSRPIPSLGDPVMEQMMGMFAQITGMLNAVRHEGLPEALRAFESLRSAAEDALPDDPLLRDALGEAAAQLRMFQGFAQTGPHPGEQDVQTLRERAQRPDATWSDRQLDHLALGGSALYATYETDLGRIDEAIEHFREALALAGPDDPERAFLQHSVALGLSRRCEISGSTAGLDEAESLLEQARELLGGPQHQLWPLVNELLSVVQMRLSRSTQGQRSGLEGQRGYAWRALLQSDAAGTKIAIKDADSQAIRLARLCLIDHNPANALRALDSGRGLMLFAATEVRGIAARLREAGQAELADRWQAAVEGSGSDNPRQEALAALTDEASSVAGLLDPPELAEIQSALLTLGVDALVYLVPAEDPLPGWAVIAPANGPPSYMALPFLSLGGDIQVEQYLTALADRAPDRARDLPPVDAGGKQLAGSLEALCDWAWRAAIGPLLQSYLGLEPTPATGQVPRLVLIPVGDLARIPWQAARHGNGTYAVQMAAISQAVSARLLCDNAARSPVPPSAVGLVVADPDTGGGDLEAARREAHAIRQAFYRGARYVGRRPDGSVSPSGPGTADQVRQWLANPSPAAGAMLHLACHGSFTTGSDGAKAYLLLAGSELSAEQIVETMVQEARREVGLVVLAACHTGRSVHGYDEVYSLGTAFLAGGVRSVLSTQWSIPDAPTSSLMYMFHHLMRDRAMPAWQALREAQLWMLDPDREPPPLMPLDLRPDPATGDPAHVVSWAGFVHWGQ